MTFQKNKKIAGMILLILIILLFIYYSYENISAFNTLFLTLTNPLNIFPITVFSIIFIIILLLNGVLLDVLMIPFNVKLKLKEALGLSIITNFYNYITPFKGGMAVRAMYLKEKHNFAYVHFLSTLSAIYIIIFFIGSFAGLISMYFLWQSQKVFNPIIFLTFLLIFLFLLAIMIFSPKIPKSKNKWINRVINVINGWHLIKNNKRIIFVTALISLIQLILGAINFIILYSIFDIQITFFQSLFITSIGSLSLLLAITPGNLGIGDAINVFSASIIGVGINEAVVATILGRAINLLIIFILGPIFSYILLNHKPGLINKVKKRNRGLK